ncbi:hypothetical protein YWY31_37950 [Paenibacillus illinoisensis]
MYDLRKFDWRNATLLEISNEEIAAGVPVKRDFGCFLFSMRNEEIHCIRLQIDFGPRCSIDIPEYDN